MKVLFVLHEGVFIYGANRSISGILQNIDYDYDLMIARSFTKKPDESELRQMFGEHLKNIYVVWLPRYRCCLFSKQGIYSEFSHVVNTIMALLHSYKRKKIIRTGGYDYVHLNSIVLYPVIDSNAKYILHIREFINPRYRTIERVKRACENAAGIIYIDEGTKRAAETVLWNSHSTIMNNPFDMTDVQNVNYMKNLRQYGLVPENIVFAMLGRIESGKGSELVLRCFMQHKDKNSRLLIVGNDSHAYAKKCKQLAKSDARIIFCGELLDTRGIYRISDYIIRGDSVVGIGRTMYEGLYAGTGVITPCTQDGRCALVSNKEFADSVYTYEIQNEKNLIEVIDECAKHKRTERKYRSNINQYMDKYYSFINWVIISKEDRV